MKPIRSLPCIETVLAPTSVARIASRVAGSACPPPTRRLHYPYYRFTFRSSTDTVLGRRVSGIRSVIDARAGTPATSDPFDVVTRSAPAADVLGPTLAESEALAVARRQVAHLVRARSRALVASRIELLDQALVYKPFFVVGDGPRSVLIDGVTGALHPLAP